MNLRNSWTSVSVCLLLCVAAFAGEDKEDAKPVRIPTKWFVGVRGHQKALDLQGKSGADMVVFFYRDMPKGEKGLHRWFRKATLNNWVVTKFLRDYIKVEVLLTANNRKQKPLAKEYYVKKTPRFVVRRPKGYRKRVDVFDWSGGKPKPVSPEELVKRIQAAGSPRKDPD